MSGLPTRGSRGRTLAFEGLRVTSLPILVALFLLSVLGRQCRCNDWLGRVERRFGACIALLSVMLLIEVR